MSIERFVPEQFITVFMSTRLNDIRLRDDPPLLRVANQDDQRRQQNEDDRAGIARFWDQYRDVVQLSFHHAGECTHFMLCDDPKWDTSGRVAEQPNRIVRLYDDEEAMIRDAFQYLRGIFGPETHQGCPSYSRMLVGWRMYFDIWPILINRAIKYRIPFYRDMRTDPDTKWPTVRHLSDIASLYLQGSGGSRKLPGLADLLKFWGFWKEPHRPIPEDIAAAVCEDPFGLAGYIELYLKDMHEVMCVYYDVNSNTNAAPSPLAGLAVPLVGAPLA